MAKKYTTIYNARAQLLFCSLKLLFGDVLVAVVAVVCLSSLLLSVSSTLHRMVASLRSHLNGTLNRKKTVLPDCIYFVQYFFHSCVFLQQTVETGDEHSSS